MDKLVGLVLENAASGKIDKKVAVDLLKSLKEMEKNKTHDPIAIIGISARLPMAEDVEEFWENIRNGRDCIGPLSKERQTDSDLFYQKFHGTHDKPDYTEGGYLKEVDKFDHEFFRLSPKEASLMDPNQRLFLETAWAALEDGGYGGESARGSRTGVYVGYIGWPIYAQFISQFAPHFVTNATVGNIPSIIASRISYLLDLRGPSMLIDTACSSSLVAVHLACESIRNGECDMAIAGGVNVNLMPVKNNSIGIDSPDSRTRTFDELSDGTGWGEGVVALLLKPLSKAIKDGDQIYAVIKGSAINQDGASIGITAPNLPAQEDVILRAWENAGVHPETISYIEAHGTGTNLGDPIEIHALQRAFRKYTDKKQFCAIGSVKTNIGHLDNTSGISGLLKTILALKHKELPPTLHFQVPNKKINFEESPVYVNTKLTKWETDHIPRRCGISSFGLSGTNCHMVLEEAPEVVQIKKEVSPQIFTLSAKTEDGLKQLVHQYDDRLSKGKIEGNLDDICFTANIGRGHYEYRLALIAKDLEDLRVKINRLKKEGLFHHPTESIYYKKHKVVSHVKQPESGEMTDTDKKSLTLEAKKLMKAYLEQADQETSLHELCRLYTEGAEIDWKQIYKGEQRRVSLPVYPFARHRCWISEDDLVDHQVLQGEEINHPLVNRQILQTLDEEIFTTSFSVDRHWVLSDHRILGLCTLPGAAYLEMVKKACQNYYGQQNIEFRDIVFLSPLVVHDNETKEVHTIIRKQDDGHEFMVVSKNGVDPQTGHFDWVTHVQGKILTFFDHIRPQYPISQMKNEYEPKLVNRETGGSSNAIEFGPRWKNVDISGVYVKDQEVLVHLQLPDELKGDLEVYELHPSLLDLATTLGGALYKGLYIPITYKKTKVYQSIPGNVYSYMRIIDGKGSSPETITFDISILDENGNACLEIQGFTLKKVRETSFYAQAAHEKDFYYGIDWVEQEAKWVKSELPEGTIVIFKDEKGYATKIKEALGKEAKNVIEVELGDSFAKQTDYLYSIGHDIKDYEQLVQELKDKEVRQILHMFTIRQKRNAEDLAELEEGQQRGVYSLFRLTKALLKHKIGEKIDLLLFSEHVYEKTGKEPFLSPEGGSLFGLGKVMNTEYAQFHCRSIDLDHYTEVEQILHELKVEDANEITLFRNGKRYVQQIKEINLDDMTNQPVSIKENGLYVISGGTGGIGLEMAKFLAKKAKVRLALLNRTKLPDRQEWSQILANGTDEKLCAKLKAIQEIERFGAEVICLSVDITDKTAVSDCFAKLREQYGNIDGVIHAAGIAGKGFILNKDEDSFSKVLSPKIEGTWILDQLTRMDHVDLFIMFSSVNSIFGEAGQSDYCAANAYMDVYSCYRKRFSKGKTITINWPAWTEIGMAVDYDVDHKNAIFKGITTKQAIEAFERVLQTDLSNVIIGEFNDQSQYAHQLEQFPIQLSPKMEANLIKSKQSRKINKHAASKKQIMLKGKESENAYTSLERMVAQIWSEELGVDQINIYDDFFQLGGDSILAIKIVNGIKQQTSLDVDVTDIFNYMTVYDLAHYLQEKIESENNEVDLKDDKTNLIEKPIEELNAYDLSRAQQRIWFLQKFYPNLTAYNLPATTWIDREIKIDRLNEALNKVIKRHSALRTIFKEEDGEVKQVILDEWTLQIEQVDLVNEENQEERLQELINKENEVVFDLTKPLVRAKVFKLEEQRYCFYLNIHHIVYDGWSSEIIAKEILEIYEALIANRKPALKPLKINYVDWIKQQEEWLDSVEAQEMKQYWLQELAKPLPTLHLPTDYPRPNTQTYNGNYLLHVLEKHESERLKKIARQLNTSYHNLLLSVYFLFLNRLTKDKDIIVGVPIAGRDQKELEDVVGLFVNSVAIRVNFNELDNFKALCEQVKIKSLQGYKNGKYPFDLLVSALNPDRDLSRNPIFSTFFQFYENLPPANEKTTLFDLTLFCRRVGENIEFRMEYNTDLFAEKTIKRYFNYFLNLLRVVLDNPNVGLPEAEMLSEEEKNQILVDLNDTAFVHPTEKTIYELFEEQVEKQGDKVAVIFDGRALTYHELNQKANQLARKLREHGVVSDDVIGIMANRSFEMIIGIMAILKAGAAYLPIDPSYPEERIKFILRDSGTKLLLVQNQSIQVTFEGTVVDLSDKTLYTGDDSNLKPVAGPNHLAYVIYTSGSTGNPKGVMIEHRSVINRLKWMQRRYPLTKKDVILQKTPFTFDVSVWELFWWAFEGAALCLLVPEGEKNPATIIEAIKNHQVTTMHFVPSMLNAFLEYLEENKHLVQDLSSLKQVFTSGEALNYQQVMRFNARLDRQKVKLINLYGPTEATVDVSYFDCPSEHVPQVIPIGKPIDNIQLFIVDEYHQLQPIGLPGELCIAGIGLARGYLNRPELNKEKFVDHPYAPGQKMYKTGDLARWMPDGNIEYLGRMDHQVKIRGYRIELGEIENQLLAHEDIKEAVVLARKDDLGDAYLCAYVVANGELSPDELKEHLAQTLPEYMIPVHFVYLDKIPLTHNGKADRKALLQYDVRPYLHAEYEAPRNELEEQLVEIWKSVLRVEQVGIQDNFFTLGGDSIKVIRLVNQMNKVLPRPLQLIDVYRNQTIKELVHYLNQSVDFEVENELEKGLQEIEKLKESIVSDENQSRYLPDDMEELYPLSKIQQSMIFYSKLRPESPIYHDQFLYQMKIKGFDLALFKRAIEIMVQKHTILRTKFYLTAFSEAVQIVHKKIEPDIQLHHLAHLSSDEQQRIIQEALHDDLLQKFELDGGLLWRIRLFDLGNDNYCMFIASFHAILDGWSAASFDTELIQIYDQIRQDQSYMPQPLKSSYRDYVAIHLGRENSEVAKQFWRNLLQGYSRNKLPFNYSGKKLNNLNHIKMYRELFSLEWLDNLEERAKHYGITLKELCLSAHIYLMHVLTTDSDVVTGVVTHDRPALEDSDKVLGCFLNTIPIRMEITQGMRKYDLMQKIKAYMVEAKANELFLVDIASAIGENNPLSNPIFDTMFNFVDFHVRQDMGEHHDVQSSDYYLELENNDMTNTLFDLEVARTLEHCVVSIKYSPNYFMDEEIETAFKLYIRILEMLASDEWDVLNKECLLSEAEKHHLVYQLNQTSVGETIKDTIYQLVESNAERHPDRIAVKFEGESYTYQEVNERANQLAHMLRRQGIKKEDIVGILLERSPRMLITILAIWKAGAAYVPIDSLYPVNRIMSIINDANIRLLITERDYEKLVESYTGPILNLDQMEQEIANANTENLNLPMDMNQLAYVIYTSGSTGKPKGAMVEHIGMMNHIWAKVQDLQVDKNSIIIQNASHCFDISIWQFFTALIVGGTTIIYSNEITFDPKAMIRSVNEDQATILQVVPSFLAEMLEEIQGNEEIEQLFTKLKYLVVTGEMLKFDLVKRWFELFPHIPVVNAYGPTEASDDITHFIMDHVPDNPTIPIGKPIRNFNIYIVDEHMTLCPMGVVGEICVSGIGVGRGYLNNQAKTEEVFMVDPFIKDKSIRLYKTGDLGRYLPDGNIEFFGRKDHQVKIRGFRIELGEIENQLLNHPSVIDAVVIDREDRAGDKYLCAYVVCKDELNVSNMREFLKEVLPNYMIPSYFVELDKLPLNPNGKVDRKALPAPLINAERRDEFVAPRNQVEAELVEIWKQVLQVESVSVKDNFFELGGHSLKATAITSAISRRLNVDVPVREIFLLPTIEELARYINQSMPSLLSTIKPVENKPYYALSSAQQRMFIVNETEGSGTSYNMPNAVLIEGQLDIERFMDIFEKLIQRHETLRTSFDYIDGVPRQIVHPKVELAYEYYEAIDEEHAKALFNAFVRPFDLSRAPLLRVGFIRLNDKKHILMYDMHHIIADGLSVSILMKEFMLLYQGVELQELRIQYKDFAEWQQDWLTTKQLQYQEDYWINVFHDHVPILELPTDYPRPSVQSFEGDRYQMKAAHDLVQKINALAKEKEMTTYMVLNAAYHILLAKYSGQDDIVIGSAVAGRPHADLENLIGMFVNILPIRNVMSSETSLEAFLAEVKENTLQAYHHADYPYEQLIDQLGLKRDLNRNPLFDVLMVSQTIDMERFQVKDLSFTPYNHLNPSTSKFDLTLEVIEQEDEIQFTFEYSTKLFNRKTIEKMADDYLKILHEIANDPKQKIGEIKISRDQILINKDVIDTVDFDF